MMDMLELLRSRRSIRKFDASRKVPDELLDKIIEAGHIAPSACNKQPWHFYLIKSDEAKEKIRQCYDREFLKEASAFVLVLGKMGKSWAYPDSYGDTSLGTDCAIATTSMMLEATAEGVGSLWICNFDREKCCKLFDLDMEVDRPFNILALGYPDVDPKILTMKRKEKEEVVTEL